MPSIYTYDDDGNLLSKTENGKIIGYSYADDKLTSYLGHNLTWTMGRQLSSFDNISYTYDENGIRASKTADGITTKYYLDGTRLIEQSNGTDAIHFNRDRIGEAIGFTCCYLSTL